MRRTNYMPIKKTSHVPHIKHEQNHLKLDRTISQEKLVGKLWKSNQKIYSSMRRTNYVPIKKTSHVPNIKQEQNHLKLDRTISQEKLRLKFNFEQIIDIQKINKKTIVTLLFFFNSSVKICSVAGNIRKTRSPQ